MPDTPEGPEFYAPPQQTPIPIPPPPSIAEAAAQYGSGQGAGHSYQYQQVYQVPLTPSSGSKGMAIAALVVGLVTIVTGWIPVWGIITGAVAVILGAVALAKKQSKGMAIGGIVTGVVGALISAVMLVIVVLAANAYNPDAWQTYTANPGYVNSGTTTIGTGPSADGLFIAEQAFGKEPTSDDVWWFVVILDNPTNSTFSGADVTVDALDADGNVIDSAWTYSTLLPGKNAVVGNFWDVEDGTITSLTVTGPDTADNEEPSGTLEVSGMTATTDEWSTRVNGTVTSTFGEDLYGGTVSVVARDASGAIIGGASAYLEEMASGDSFSFSATFYYPLPDDATFEAFGLPY